MLRAIATRFWRGMPWLASGLVHLALLGTVLAVAARAIPRLPAFVVAELVALESAWPAPIEPPKPRITPPAPRATPPPPKAPTRLPRLIAAPPPAVLTMPQIEEVPPDPPPSKLAPDPARAREEAPRPDREPDSRSAVRSDQPPSPAADPRPASGAASRPGAGSVASPSAATGDLPATADGLTGVSRLGGAVSGATDTGRGAGGGQTSVSLAGTGGGVTRTAIPRGGYQVQPRYPTSARRQGIQGTTLLRVFVAIDGRVTEVSVERTAGHADLDEAAAEAVRRWRFEPARSGDMPVAMWVLLPVEFRLK